MTLSSNEIIALNDSGLEWGSCYDTIETNNTRYIDCSVKLYNRCDGIFISGKDCQSDGMFSSFKNSEGYWDSISLPISSFSNINPGDDKYNSIYIGTYIPSTITINNAL